MKTNKILTMLWLAVLALPFFTACDSDTDSNPIFHEAPTFVLNESAYAINNTYDLSTANTTVTITCNQPDYGFPVATTYIVQLAFEAEAFDMGEDNFTELGTQFNNTRISIDANELNTTLGELYNSLHEGEDLPTNPVAVYIRLRAIVTGQTIGNSISNVICLPSVLMSPAQTLALPEHMWLAGSMNGWEHKPMPQVHGLNGQYYMIIRLEDNGQFKFGTKEGEWLGANDSRLTIVNNTSGNVEDDGSDNHNINFSKGGWYVIHWKTVVKGTDYAFTMTVSEAKVYLIGSCVNQDSWGFSDEFIFTESTDEEGNAVLVSPMLPTDNEVRMAVNAGIDGIDWWRTEFTLESGATIVYRDSEHNCDNNWSGDVGAKYSISAPGKKIQMNFNAGTGKVID